MTPAIVGAIFIIVTTFITRATTRDIANLQARHKVLDRQSETLSEYVTAVHVAAAAAEQYLWWGGESIREEAAQKYFGRATEAYSALEHAGDALPSGDTWVHIRARHDDLVEYLRTLALKKLNETTEESLDFYIETTKSDSRPVKSTLAACAFAEALITAQYRESAPDSLADGIRSRASAVLNPRRNASAD